MKVKTTIILLLLGLMTFLPSICFARDYRDSIVMHRVWSFAEKMPQDVSLVESNAYSVFTMNVKRRNVLLWLIPSMYSIAHGDKNFVGEVYGKAKLDPQHRMILTTQAKYGTIPHFRKPIPALFEMTAPNIYGDLFYSDRLLSPFRHSNRQFYKYRITYDEETAHVKFIPRMDNTQLVEGEAKVNFHTGCVDSLFFKGEFDMVKFKVSVCMNPEQPYGLPKNSQTEASFKFMGNNIQAHFNTLFDCPKTLPDSIQDRESIAAIESVRPIPLSPEEEKIYHGFDTRQQQEEQIAMADSASEKGSKAEKVKDFLWDVVGDHMVNSTGISSGNAYMRISPLFNPFYMSYSSTKGLSYKLSAYAIYKWNDHRFLTFEPDFGYNIKLKQIYYTIPLHMTYNPKRSGVASIVWGNGNRTSNGALAEKYNKILGDSIVFPEFRDEYVTVSNRIALFDWIHWTTGITYHIRRATTNRDMLEKAGFPYSYRSFAPSITVHLIPWTKGPIVTANYERSIMKVLGSNLQYERWEFDGSYKHDAKGMRILNLRAGAGFYTNRSTDYFVDFTNFHDNNLPTGWDDDWSGQFQLLDSRWYNESNYYVRGHISYDSPLLALSWVPWAGRFVETERLYFSALGVERTRAYFELGYGLKCRYFSTGLFASFLNTHYHSFEFKFTFELFRRW